MTISKAKQTDNKLIVVVPLHNRPAFNLLEQYSVDNLIKKANTRKILFLAANSMNKTYYSNRYPEVELLSFEDNFFESNNSSNKLFLNKQFYKLFESYDFMLVHHPDAFLVQDDLDDWMIQNIDYIGAPIPEGVEVRVKIGKFFFGNGLTVKAFVGNGGFSLRHINKSISLMEEFAEIHEKWLLNSGREDLFFSIAGLLSSNYCIPNQLVASRFSLELEGEKYFNFNDCKLPTGFHGWWKNDIDFYKNLVVKTS
ncbi:MAG: hypothetical protein HQM10_21465 [Candidatus Riflebacteria bacterium]|nr:hypothetical protein [Candidatus Riflebacteria bacterium]